jgi:hypothetical protein
LDIVSKSPESLADAYRLARYRVLTEPAFVLRIGQYCPELAAWHAANRVVETAFLTAANPGSRLLSDSENHVRHEQLISLVERYPFAPGCGEDPDHEWPDEPSLLIGGLTVSEAQDLARRFGQNAFVHIGLGACPRLVWTREEIL